MSAWALLSVLALGGAAADLLTKEAAFSYVLSHHDVADKAAALQDRGLPPDVILHALHLQVPLVDGVHLSLSTNSGVVFGMPMPRGASLAVTCVTMLLVLGVFAFSPARNRLVQIAMGLILAGAAGNFYDRAVGVVSVPGLDQPIRYQVRDFIDCSDLTTFGGKSYYPWVFNVADVLLVLGVALPLVQWMIQGTRRRKTGT